MKLSLSSAFLGSLLLGSARAASFFGDGPFPAGIPGSGYGCDLPCNTGDKNYVIHAKIATYNLANSGLVDNPQKLSPNSNDIAYKTRTFVGDADLSDPFCQGDDDGSNGVLGPCLSVNPGEIMNIKIINNFGNGMSKFGQRPADENEFFSFIDSIPVGALPGPRAANAGELNILNEEDMPGVHVSFDDTNLHLHGLHVVPHMFYPQGTNNQDADWITITVRTYVRANAQALLLQWQ